MPKYPMPVPPIFEPEVAADAVHWAAHNKRREVYVGVSSVYTILGNKIAPWLAERYLARTAVSGQQTDPEVDGVREGNLFESTDLDPGARGRYSDQAHSHSIQLWATKHRRALLGGLVAVVAAAGAGGALRD
jgi:hypothetical protein